MTINNKDICWGIIFGVGLAYVAGGWATPIAVALFGIGAFSDWLIETGRVKRSNGGDSETR